MNSTDKKRWHNLEKTIALSMVKGVGLNRLILLLDYFGTAEEVFQASKNELIENSSITPAIAKAIKAFDTYHKARDYIEQIQRLGWEFMLKNEPLYPGPLKNIPACPAFLFYKGTFSESDTNAMAIVGSRHASENGLLFANSLGRDLAGKGVTVISGMARGVDTSAHRGALEAGGRTIAVWGSSLENIYPPENRHLTEEIIKSGAIISEFLPETIPDGHNFPRRNRIISGLSQGVIVIEAAEKSGALSTVSHALAQNREVFAVPGSPRSSTSKGTNRLLKEGATLLTGVDDIFEALPRLNRDIKAIKVKNEIFLTTAEKNIIDLFDDKPIHIDNLSRDAEQPVINIMPLLLALELKGVIKELSGKRYILE